MGWQLRRGLLNPESGPSPGSPWWRAVNESLLRDTSEARELAGDKTISAGLATFDYNNDGWIDILFLNGSPLPGAPASTPRNALYRNNGNWRFTDVTEQAGLLDTNYHLGVCIGDYDNDGDLDLVVANYIRWSKEIDEGLRCTLDGTLRAYCRPDAFEGAFPYLYRNNGDGTFTDVTAASRTADPGWSVSASFVDIDRDGWLDLFVGNYFPDGARVLDGSARDDPHMRMQDSM